MTRVTAPERRSRESPLAPERRSRESPLAPEPLHRASLQDTTRLYAPRQVPLFAV